MLQQLPQSGQTDTSFKNVREYLPIVDYALDISMNTFLNYLL